MGTTDTFLMDNDGATLHTWSSLLAISTSAYLLEDGSLLRTANTGNAQFDVGGASGRIERLDQNNSVLWSFDYASAERLAHHDIHPLPNGNVLVIAWELQSESDALAAGRDPALINAADGLWSEVVIEVEPTGPDTGDIVWEWRAWDHLVQDFDPARSNFGAVADHPEKIDLNYGAGGPDPVVDWLHINSIDYNEDLDQILLSVPTFNEIWIIDHSTTTAEAAGSAGDLLFRWGNPQAYDRGMFDDQQLFFQHDAEWIDEGLPGAGDILLFNNGAVRSDGTSYSSIDQIRPPLLSDGTYEIGVDGTYGPSLLTWNYQASPNIDFFSPVMSSAQRLANGNTLIGEGVTGRMFEVDSSGDTVWEYLSGSAIFHVDRYAPDYAGLTPYNQP